MSKLTCYAPASRRFSVGLRPQKPRQDALTNASFPSHWEAVSKLPCALHEPVVFRLDVVQGRSQDALHESKLSLPLGGGKQAPLVLPQAEVTPQGERPCSADRMGPFHDRHNDCIRNRPAVHSIVPWTKEPD
ncbi:MAG: hypothetical protein HRU19_32585 [Pseudobacteriovorax sp.]|nr:hypothetical protein [Pseudobacteriovorax sp.]